MHFIPLIPGVLPHLGPHQFPVVDATSVTLLHTLRYRFGFVAFSQNVVRDFSRPQFETRMILLHMSNSIPAIRILNQYRNSVPTKEIFWVRRQSIRRNDIYVYHMYLHCFWFETVVVSSGLIVDNVNKMTYMFCVFVVVV
jgi:hypothetical protein